MYTDALVRRRGEQKRIRDPCSPRSKRWVLTVGIFLWFS